MKYHSLSSGKLKQLNIPICKGVNLSDARDSITDGQLSDAKNVWYEGERLKTRSGFFSETDNIIYPQISGGAGRHNFKLTDTYFFHSGENKRIATEKFYYDLSACFVCVYLIGTSGSVTPAGYLHFGRVDDNAFYIPENIIFYVGAPQNGGGIFAFTSLVNEADYVGKEQRIYEINSELDGWNLVTEYYIPTVYINGRGNAYEKAIEAVNATYTGTPTELEPPNLLTGNFYAYYTSDGYSYSFRLPFSNLSNSSVVCRISETNFSHTQWAIAAEATQATATFFGVEVTAHLDREKGIINFTVPAGNFPVPKMDMCNQNNIQILVSMDIYNNFNAVVSSTCCASLGSRTIFSGGLEKNKLYYTRYDNPLYFPANTDEVIGFSDSPITGLYAVDNKILAFKDSETYSITLKKGNSLNQTALLDKNPTIFYENDKFNVKCLNRKIGCKNSSTISSYRGYPIWYSTDNNIYSISPSGSIYKLSKAITPFFLQSNPLALQAAMGFCTDSHYFLSLDNKLAVMEFDESGLKGNTENISFYLWELPNGYSCLGGVANDNNFCFLLENKAENSFFISTLKGDCDVMISNGVTESFDIGSSITTKAYSLGDLRSRNKIKSVYLKLESAGEIKINLFCGKGIFADFNFREEALSKEEDGMLRLIAELNGAKSAQLTLESNKAFSLGGLEIYYISLVK